MNYFSTGVERGFILAKIRGFSAKPPELTVFLDSVDRGRTDRDRRSRIERPLATGGAGGGADSAGGEPSDGGLPEKSVPAF